MEILNNLLTVWKQAVSFFLKKTGNVKSKCEKNIKFF